MKHIIIIVFALISLAAYTYAHKNKALPEAIRATFLELAGDGVIQKSEIEKEDDGSITYEARIQNEQGVVEIKLDAAGKVIEVEKEIAPADLPQAVREALQSGYPHSQIEAAEQVTQNTLTFYEVELETNDDTEVEIKINSDGTILSTEIECDD